MLSGTAGIFAEQAHCAEDGMDNLVKSQRLYAEGKYAEAVPLAIQALSDNERILGKEHTDTLHSLQNLALIYSALLIRPGEVFMRHT
jgi:hypothetical protein